MWDKKINDKLLFNREAFEYSLKISPDPLSVYKEVLDEGNHYLEDQFKAGKPIKTLVSKRAWLIDQLLDFAWRSSIYTDDLALVAVGGYGRGELLPASDIDLMILQTPRTKKDVKQQIESFLVFLWDIGLEVGHSVRTVKDCIRESLADITVVTNLMESRLLCGNKALYESMCKATSPKKIWPTRKFFQAKWDEQISRHHKFADTEHNLEPNIKEGPGGLRDIQMIGWVAKRHFEAARIRELIQHGFLTKDEYHMLDSSRDLLWRIRFALHIITDRREDRLLFDFQRNVAELLGFHAHDNSGVEQFMKMYYQTVREMNRLNEMLLQHFQEAIIYAKRREKIKPVNKRFQIRNDFIEVCNNDVFKHYPSALLEIFLLIQQNPSIKGVRSSTIRLIRKHTEFIDDEFRKDIRNRSLFLEIMRQPHRVGHVLRRMHRYGILSSYLPEFRRIEGLMQFDLFHIYTVDEHILFVVRNMRSFGFKQYAQRFPLCQQILEQLPKQELLYIAGLFHDIAKGRRGNHSKTGAKVALDFCYRHDLSDYDSKLVSWLVEKHLLMSVTAQKMDINDPNVVNNFANNIGDQLHLNYLFLLTVADICATNPEIWNNWKSALLADLYHKTLNALRRGLENPINKSDLIKEVKEEVLALIRKTAIPRDELLNLWQPLGDDYFLQHSPDEIMWHSRSIMKTRENALPLVLVRRRTDRGGSQVFIYTRDADKIFAASTRALDQMGLNIVDARIITSDNGFALDTYVVLENDGDFIKDRSRCDEIKTKIKHGLMHLDNIPKHVTRRGDRQLKHFTIPIRVKFSSDERNGRTIMEVTASDRPGFLSQVGVAMNFCGVRLHGAKIATYGERVEDIFYITDKQNNIITEPLKFECLQSTITDALTPK
ncbi:MAG: [protein-PII] uridylyltransferase [Gammaproteobacteria bacterium]